MRSANSPISDFAEVLFCRAYGWAREGNSVAGYDATDASAVRYQIKARRLATRSGSRQLSAIRNLASNPFDQLAAVLFDRDFVVYRAALVPVSVVKTRVRQPPRTNSDIFLLRDDIWTLEGVVDVTDDIRAAAHALSF